MSRHSTIPALSREKVQGAARPTGAENRPSPSSGIFETARLILIVWVGLALMTALLQWLIGRSAILHLAAMLIGGGFAAVALFDHLWRRANRPERK